MKINYWVVIGCIALGIVACKKDVSTSTNEPPVEVNTNPHKVQFNINTFDVSYENMSGREMGGEASLLDEIFYAVYDSNGKIINSVVQEDKQSPYFGKFQEYLNSGEYTVVFVGRSTLYGGYTQLKLGNLIDSTNSLYHLTIFNDYTGRHDLFLYKNKVIIGYSDTTISGIQLSRLTGLLEVHILEDTTDAGFSGLIQYAPHGYHPDYEHFFQNSYGGVDSTFLSYQSWEKNRNILKGYCFGTERNLTISLSMWKGGQYFYKTINNVKVYPNKKTILTGKIDDRLGVVGDIKVDTTFSGAIYQNF